MASERAERDAPSPPDRSEGERDDPPLFNPRRERRMTRTHAVMWTVILTATVLDIILTIAGLQLGLREGNVVVRTMIDSFGLSGLFGVKLAAMAWLVAGWSLLSDRNAAVFLGLFAAVTVTVVVHNAITLFGL
jgi:hypothetical protein